MRFSVDTYFHIGHEHLVQGLPCQDHALSGRIDGAIYAIVADGCSTGGLTDIGARFMSLSAAKAIAEHWTDTHDASLPDAPQEVSASQRSIFDDARHTFRLTQSDMLATCSYVYLGANGGFVHMHGDGVIALSYRDGSRVLHRFDWANNTPFYPAYADDYYASFISAHGGDPTALALMSQEWEVRSGVMQKMDERSFSIEEGVVGITIPLSPKLINDLESVAVFTDGVERVDGTALLAFKSTEGVFAKRRMMRFIQQAEKTGKGPLDDIAYAVVRIEPEVDEERNAENAS